MGCNSTTLFLIYSLKKNTYNLYCKGKTLNERIFNILLMQTKFNCNLSFLR